MSSDGMLITQEIGSFRKPEYLSRHFHSIQNSKEFEDLASRATKETLDLFSSAGLMNVGVGGEMFRWEMYEHLARHTGNVTFHGKVRSFDNRYYNKGSVTGDLYRKSPAHSVELEKVLQSTKSRIKVPITGPYTMADWSFNDHYGSRLELANAFADIIHQEVLDLTKIWKQRRPDELLEIQIDEPAATTHPKEMDIVVESVNRSVRNIPGIETSIHVCYSRDYNLIYDRMPDLELDGLNLEYANRDSLQTGTGSEKRPGYSDLREFRAVLSTLSKAKFIGIGVTDVHIDEVESVELIADRIRTAIDLVGDPEIIRLNPDCGLRTRSREIGFMKIRNMVEARNLVMSQL